MKEIYNDGPDNYPARKVTLSSASATRVSPKATALSLVTFTPGSMVGASHQGLFLAHTETSTTGTLWDLTFEIPGNSTTLSRHTLRPAHGANARYSVKKRENWDIMKAAREGKLVEFIPDAGATPKRMDRATQKVFDNFKYEYTKENCQTFIVLVLKLLREWDPAHVSLEAIEFVRKRTTFTVRHATRHDREYAPEVVAARTRPRFTSSEVFQEEVPRHQDVRARGYRSSSSSGAFAPDVAVLPAHYAGRRGGRSDPTPAAHGPVRVHRAEYVNSEDRAGWFVMPGAWE